MKIYFWIVYIYMDRVSIFTEKESHLLFFKMAGGNEENINQDLKQNETENRTH